MIIIRVLMFWRVLTRCCEHVVEEYDQMVWYLKDYINLGEERKCKRNIVDYVKRFPGMVFGILWRIWIRGLIFGALCCGNLSRNHMSYDNTAVWS